MVFQKMFYCWILEKHFSVEKKGLYVETEVWRELNTCPDTFHHLLFSVYYFGLKVRLLVL